MKPHPKSTLWTFFNKNLDLLQITEISEPSLKIPFLEKSDRWYWQHDFGRIPAIVVTDLGGNNYDIEPERIDEAAVEILWNTPTAGYLYLV